MHIELPEKGRPRGVRYRKCELGVDLPATFMSRLKSIDPHFYPVFHPYRVLWDSIINEYSGPLDDPRYQIKREYCELNFGFVLTNGQGEPSPDGTWHIWRWCEPASGWAHIINIDSRDPEYLNFLVERIWLQAQYNDQFGRGYQRKLEEADLERRDKLMADRDDMMREISKANSGMLGRAAENFGRGITQATNPTKEIITSFSGQSNKSKIVRPITDREGGLILPEDW
jgi:hypothetical protein